MRRLLLVLPLLLAAPAPGFAAGGDWPRFRGPDGSGLSDAAFPALWTEADYRWKVALPAGGHSSPVVVGRRIFLACGEKATARRLVVCLDVADGHPLWQREFPSTPFRQHNDNSYASASPAADDAGVVVTWSTPEEVVLLALDSDGHDLWRRGLGPFVGIHGSGASPIIEGDLVLLVSDQEDPHALAGVYGANANQPAGKSFLLAVDRKTGQTRWQLARKTVQAAYATPTIHRPAGAPPEVIVTSTGQGVTAVDLATGKVKWELAGAFDQRCVGSPVVGTTPEGTLVIAGDGFAAAGTHFVAVRPPVIAPGPAPGATPVAAAGVPPANPALTAAPAQATLVYEVKKPVPLVPTPLVHAGRLYLWGDDGRVQCLRAATGEPLWRERIPGSFYGSPVCAAGRVYCIAKNGDVVVLAAGDKFELLARVPLGEPSFATPAIADGVMYLRTSGHLFALGK